MNNLSRLIDELCPNGVEYKTIGEIAIDIYRGAGIKRSEVVEEGTPCVRYGEIYTTYGIWFDECVSHTMTEYVSSPKYFEYGDILFAITGERIDDIAKSCAYVGHERCLAGGDIVVLKHAQNPKYLSYALSTTAARIQKGKGKVKSKVVHASVPSIQSIIIPLPPIEIQNEVVRILDNYERVQKALSSEITDEIQARKAQYNYYLNRFFDSQIDNRVPLSTLGTLTRGKRFVHKDASEKGIPCIHYGELYTYYGVSANSVKSHIREELREKMRYAHKNDVIIVGAGENNEDIGIGVAWQGEESVAVHDACYTLRHTQNPLYISYYLRSELYHKQIKKYVSEGKICSISAEGIGKALIPVPPIEEQNKIVDILSRLENLSNIMLEFLPKEIEERQKQYESYRDKLLTFKGTV